MTYRNIRTSMALDHWTLNTLKTLAGKFGISKSEVMRKAVRTLNEQVEHEKARPSPLQALDFLQSSGGLSVQESEAFREEMQAERHAKRYWWE
jgi:Arc/MetJ-type ribon-helix-helix transcriptional regulator